ncbi:MAG: TetR family transcriptional regulator [Solirubrobacteraceae bacterium]|nr:TetR family transcriptional regulator [Solirubrobacteraceae bacterium]
MDISGLALELFDRDGYDATTVDAIAAAAGIGRRTLFRYHPSKPDIVWGDFRTHVERFRGHLAATEPGVPLMTAIRRAVLAFNDYGPDATPELRVRMRLITTVPALQAHAMLRHREWCDAIAEFVADHTDAAPDDLLPTTIAQGCLGASTAAFRVWIERDGELLDLLDEAYRTLDGGLDGIVTRPA